NAEEPVTSDGKVNLPDAINGSVNKPDTFNINSRVPDPFKVVRDNENISSHKLLLALPDLKKAVRKESEAMIFDEDEDKDEGDIGGYVQPNINNQLKLVDWIKKEYQTQVSQIKQMTDRKYKMFVEKFILETNFV
ncbi:5445_t:CDS:2, partial [Funneliformis mosseae]